MTFQSRLFSTSPKNLKDKNSKLKEKTQNLRFWHIWKLLQKTKEMIYEMGGKCIEMGNAWLKFQIIDENITFLSKFQKNI